MSKQIMLIQNLNTVLLLVASRNAKLKKPGKIMNICANKYNLAVASFLTNLFQNIGAI